MAYLLFYSNYCVYSQKFIKILENSQDNGFFYRIPVDKDSNGLRPEQIYKYKIDEVPTIIVDNSKLSGIHAFRWLQSRSKQNTSIQTRQHKIQMSPSEKNKIPNQSQSGPLPFNKSNNDFLSVDDVNVPLPDIVEESDPRIQNRSHPNFILSDDNIIQTPITTDNQKYDKNDSLKSKQLDNEYNKLLQDRESSVSQPIQRI